MASYTVDAQRIFEALLNHHRGETGEPYGHFTRLRRYDWEPTRFMARIDRMNVAPKPGRDAPGLAVITVLVVGHDGPWQRAGKRFVFDLANVLLDRIETFE